MDRKDLTVVTASEAAEIYDSEVERIPRSEVDRLLDQQECRIRELERLNGDITRDLERVSSNARHDVLKYTRMLNQIADIINSAD